MVGDKGISVSADRSGDNQEEFTRDKIRAAQGPVLFGFTIVLKPMFAAMATLSQQMKR